MKKKGFLDDNDDDDDDEGKDRRNKSIKILIMRYRCDTALNGHDAAIEHRSYRSGKMERII